MSVSESKSGLPPPGSRGNPGIQEWKKSLMLAQGALLMEMARHYLGDDRLPFDKPVLVDRLEVFLRKPQTVDSIVSLIGHDDIVILGCLDLAGPLTERELGALLQYEMLLAWLKVAIVNLQDRMLLFCFRIKGEVLYALNPLFINPVRSLVSRYFFHSVIHKGSSFGLPARIPDTVMPVELEETLVWFPQVRPEQEGQTLSPSAVAVSLLCVLLHSPALCRKDGTFTSRGFERLTALFPESKPEMLGLISHALSKAGLLPKGDPDEGKQNPGFAMESGTSSTTDALKKEYRFETIDAFLTRNTLFMPVFLACAASADADVAKERVRETALRISESGILNELCPGSEYPLVSILRVLGISMLTACWKPDCKALMSALKDLGFLSPVITSPLSSTRSDPEPIPDSEWKPGTLVFDGTQSFHLLPTSSLRDRFFLGIVTKTKKIGKVSCYELDKSIFRSALDMGLDPGFAEKRLSRLVRHPLPQSVNFLLESWEKEYAAIRLYRGIVLVANDRVRSVLEHELVLLPVIDHILAPGVYLLSPVTMERLSDALATAGLKMPAVYDAGQGKALNLDAETGQDRIIDSFSFSKSMNPANGADTSETSFPGGSCVSVPVSQKSEVSVFLPASPGNGISNSDVILENLVRTASATYSGLDPRMQFELSDRIARKLVLGPLQMRLAGVRPVRMEAGGLDYQGKLRIVDRAIKHPIDRLEILYPDANGGARHLYVRAVRLEKNGTDIFLEAENLYTGSPVRLNLAAAVSIRRIPASPFGDQS